MADSPELVAARLAGDAFTEATGELHAAFARAEAKGELLPQSEYRPILERIEIAETNFRAAMAHLK